MSIRAMSRLSRTCGLAPLYEIRRARRCQPTLIFAGFGDISLRQALTQFHRSRKSWLQNTTLLLSMQDWTSGASSWERSQECIRSRWKRVAKFGVASAGDSYVVFTMWLPPSQVGPSIPFNPYHPLPNLIAAEYGSTDLM